MGDTSPRSSSDTQADQSSQKDRSQSPKRSEGDRSQSPKGDRSQHSRSPDFAAEPRFQPWYEAAQKRLEEKFGERFGENLPKEHYDQMKQELQKEFDRDMKSSLDQFYQRSKGIQMLYKMSYDKLCSSIRNELEKLRKEIKSGLSDALEEDTKELLKAYQKRFLELRREQRKNPKKESEHLKDIRELYDDLVSEKKLYKIKLDKASQNLMARIKDTIVSMSVATIGQPSSNESESERKRLESTNRWKTYVEHIDKLKGEYDQKRSQLDIKLSNSFAKIVSDKDNAQANLREGFSNASRVLEDLKKRTTQNN
ncbi:MAG TPA: hypothetical protein VK553_06025 [Candidatus Nitrosopolaris rasttigaisensis]|nr:hypothetical protein [Candidatus Nitrosopolaris rasttigaisensis]